MNVSIQEMSIIVIADFASFAFSTVEDLKAFSTQKGFFRQEPAGEAVFPCNVIVLVSRKPDIKVSLSLARSKTCSPRCICYTMETFLFYCFPYGSYFRVLAFDEKFLLRFPVDWLTPLKIRTALLLFCIGT